MVQECTECGPEQWAQCSPTVAECGVKVNVPWAAHEAVAVRGLAEYYP